MATISELLSQLQSDKNTLVTNLITKGVTADNSETFTSLVPKVLDITSGGIDTSDATATSTDLLLNKTAYVNGKKITIGTIYFKSLVKIMAIVAKNERIEIPTIEL